MIRLEDQELERRFGEEYRKYRRDRAGSRTQDMDPLKFRPKAQSL